MTFAVLIMAKSPIPGQVKTRLSPPFSPTEAARLANAAIEDTLAAAAASGAHRVLVALAGDPAPIGPPLTDCEHFPQRSGTLGQRLDHAFATCWAATRSPAVVVGMDTPHVTAQLLGECVELTRTSAATAALGLAHDGGFWSLAFREQPVPVLHRVAMSRPDTGALTQRELRTAGVRVALAPQLEDVDDAESARRVAAAAPTTRFAREYRRLTRAPADRGAAGD